MPRSKVDVAVVGGGPAGLAVANAVLRARPGTTVKVLEAAQTYIPQGAGVLLNVNGFRALHAINPALQQKLEDASIYLTSLLRVNEQGEVTHRTQPFDAQATRARTGYAHKMVAWHDIRSTLFEALPPGIVQFGCKGRGFRHMDDGSVELRYDTTSRPAEADGSGAGTGESEEAADAAADQEEAAAGRSTRHTIQASIVVGADGYFSRLREAILHDGPPRFNQRLAWRARVQLDPAAMANLWLDDPGACRFWGNMELLGKDRAALMYPVGGGVYCWTVNCSLSHLQAKGYNFHAHDSSNMMSVQGGGGSDPQQRCLSIVDSFPEDLLNLIRATPTNLITEHGYYKRPLEEWPEKSWGEGGVTLVGDAAHLAPPDGQGLNLALEDAAVLGWHLQQSGLTPQALRKYEAERIPRLKSILQYGEMNPLRQPIIEDKLFEALSPAAAVATV